MVTVIVMRANCNECLGIEPKEFIELSKNMMSIRWGIAMIYIDWFNRIMLLLCCYDVYGLPIMDDRNSIRQATAEM